MGYSSESPKLLNGLSLRVKTNTQRLDNLNFSFSLFFVCLFIIFCERERERKMLQFPTLMSQFASLTKTIPASHLLPIQWPQPQNEEILLAMEEAEFEEKVSLCFLSTLSRSNSNDGKPVFNSLTP